MDIDSIDFQAIANTGITAQEAAETLAYFFNHPDHQKFFEAFDAGYRARFETLKDGTPITDAPAIEYPDGRKYRQDGTVW